MVSSSSGIRAAATAAALALAATTVPVSASAGTAAADTLTAGHGRPGLELDLSAALLTPLADLVPSSGTTGALQLSAGAGVRGGGVWWLGPRLAIGLGGVWVPADVDRQASPADGGGTDPGGKVGEADYLAGTAELVVALPAVSDRVRIEPFLVAGLGLRRLALDAGEELPDGVTDPVAALGGGFRMLVSEALLLRLEARDQVAPATVGAESRIQHDLTVSVGLGVRP